jgi:hypothetical protein
MTDTSDHEHTVEARCLTPDDPVNFLQPFEKWTDCSSPISPAVAAFRSNLRAARTVGTLPCRLIRGSVAGRAELIESGADPNSEQYSEQEEHSYRLVKRAWREHESTPEYKQSVANETLSILSSSLRYPYFSEASQELLRQVVVMIWSAFEVISNDLGITIINQIPALSRTVMQLGTYKNLKGIPIAILEEFRFDLSQTMGDILFSTKRLNTVPSIADFYSSVFSNVLLQKSMKSPTLWLLAQRRHLIVHRRGIVDIQYLQNTSETQALGTRINVPANEVTNSLIEVRDLGLLMADCALGLLNGSVTPSN